MGLKPPMLIINMKAYREVLGGRAVELAKAAEYVSREFGISIAVAPPHTLISEVARNVDIPVIAQGIDVDREGAFTGHITPKMVREAGAVGVILNHSENQLTLNRLADLVDAAKSANLFTLICAATPKAAAAAAALSPDAVAIEPPELIGTGRAVSRERPEVVTNGLDAVRRISKEIIYLVGAGIESGDDVRRAVELGAQGVLVASAVVKAGDWVGKIRELATGLIGR